MPIYLRQSTASQEVPLGPFVDDTDGKTAETALSIANTDVKVWASGATTLANKNSGGATHISGGIYYAVLDATDTATVGPLVIFVNMTGALAVRVECVVLHANVYDTLFGSTALSTYAGGAVASVTGAVGSVTGNVGGNVVGSVASVTGAVGSVTGNVGGSVASVVGAVGSVTGAVGSVTGNVGGNVTGTVASVVGNVGGNVVGSVASVTNPVTLTAAYDAAKTAGDATAANQTTINTNVGLVYSRLGAPAGASISADIQTRLPTASMPPNWPASVISVDGICDVNVVKYAGEDTELSGDPLPAEVTNIDAIVEAVGAATVDGPISRSQAERLILAALAGDVSGDGRTYLAPDGTTSRLEVAPSGSDGRTVTRTP